MTQYEPMLNLRLKRGLYINAPVSFASLSKLFQGFTLYFGLSVWANIMSNLILILGQCGLYFMVQ